MAVTVALWPVHAVGLFTEALGKELLVITMSSVEAVQVPFEIDHLKVEVVPAESPVIVDVFEDDVVIVGDAPETTDHAPVPEAGELAAIVKVLLSHWLISEPAAAVVGTVETVPEPVASFTAVAPELVQAISPLAPLLADEVSLTYMVVELTVPPL